MTRRGSRVLTQRKTLPSPLHPHLTLRPAWTLRFPQAPRAPQAIIVRNLRRHIRQGAGFINVQFLTTCQGGHRLTLPVACSFLDRGMIDIITSFGHQWKICCSFLVFCCVWLSQAAKFWQFCSSYNADKSVGIRNPLRTTGLDRIYILKAANSGASLAWPLPSEEAGSNGDGTYALAPPGSVAE